MPIACSLLRKLPRSKGPHLHSLVTTGSVPECKHYTCRHWHAKTTQTNTGTPTTHPQVPTVARQHWNANTTPRAHTSHFPKHTCATTHGNANTITHIQAPPHKCAAGTGVSATAITVDARGYSCSHHRRLPALAAELCEQAFGALAHHFEIVQSSCLWHDPCRQSVHNQE